MGNKYRQPPADLVRAQLNVTNRVTKLEQNPRSVATSVDTGNWSFVAANGQHIVQFGDEGNGIGAGWVFRRGSNGTLAFFLGGSAGNQFFALHDNAGNILFSDNTDASGTGIARPYLTHEFIRYANFGTAEQNTTLTTFVGAYNIRGYRQHPNLSVEFVAFTPAGASMEVQLVDTSTVPNTIIAGPTTFGPSTFTFGSFVTPVPNFGYMNPLNVDLQIRVSAGAGTVGVSMTFAYGVQA